MEPDEDHPVDIPIDALQHTEGTRPRSNDSNVLWKFLDQQILAVAVRVGDQEFGGTGGPGALHCRQDLGRHDAPESLVLEPSRVQLLGGHRTRETLHVGDDQHTRSDLENAGG